MGSSAGRLTLTFKPRPALKWHDRAPCGRPADIHRTSCSAWSATHRGPPGTLVLNNASPSRPRSAQRHRRDHDCPQTQRPDRLHAELVRQLWQLYGQIIVYPKEAAGSGLNLSNDSIGTGPFQLKSHQPSVSFTLERNPEYWDKDAAMFDTIEMPIVQEYAARLSQLKAGNIYYGISANTVRAEDVLTLKSDEPRIQLYQSSFDTSLPGTVMTFGPLPAGGNKYQDERVRQAVWMSWAAISTSAPSTTSITSKRPACRWKRNGAPV